MASAIASPIAVTPDVAKATEEHLAAHAAATAGEHAALAPAVVATAYLDDDAAVAAAKAEFQKVFDAYTAGTVPLPVAPIFAPAPTVAAAAPVAPAAVAAPFSYGYYPGAYGFGGYGGYGTFAGYGGYGTFAGYGAGYPSYAGYPYAGYPYAGWGPVVTAPAAEKTE